MMLLVSAALAWTTDSRSPLPVLSESETRAYVILSTAPEAGWYANKPTLHVDPRKDAPTTQALVSYAAARLPAELKSYQGKSLFVYGAGAEVCKATVTSLAVIRRFAWMEGYTSWESDERCKERDSKACTDAIVEETAGQGETLLVGVLDGCANVAETQVASLTEQTVAMASRLEPDDALSVQARALFTVQPAWIELQKAYVRAPEGSPFWDGGEPSVQSFDWMGSTLVAVSGDAFACGGFTGSLWVLWEIVPGEGPESWKLLFTGSESFSPLLLSDSNRDNQFEPLRDRRR